jgi:hypothetical protein
VEQAVISGDPELACPKPVATLEVFDTLTGRTQVLYPNDPEH